MASASAHAQGERTAVSAWWHAGAIIENILLAAGKREGSLKVRPQTEPGTLRSCSAATAALPPPPLLLAFAPLRSALRF